MSLVPNLITAINHTPMSYLEQVCFAKQCEIEHWFRTRWHEHTPPFYGSVDLRNSGFKITTVDMNLFPGGFNNLDTHFIALAVQAVNTMLEKMCTDAQRILLIPENHTKNIAYLNNVYTLKHILQQAGLEVEIGSLSPDVITPTEVDLHHGRVMTYYPLVRQNDRIKTSHGFEPCLILLNNDLSAGCPEILVNLPQQKLLPPLNAGWYMRRKTNYFTAYAQVAQEFATLLGVDPWLIDAYFDIATDLDFASRVGLEGLAVKVDAVLERIRIKYQEYKIQDEPYVIVKANNGTYGMGIMVVKSGAEIIDINRKSRNKMAVIKDGQSVTDVIIQEGVHTCEELDGASAEPVVYMMHNAVIGSFYRVHPDRGREGNLNAVGAKFVPLDVAGDCLPCIDGAAAKPNRFYTYGVLARLALLASSIELSKYT